MHKIEVEANFLQENRQFVPRIVSLESADDDYELAFALRKELFPAGRQICGSHYINSCLRMLQLLLCDRLNDTDRRLRYCAIKGKGSILVQDAKQNLIELLLEFKNTVHYNLTAES